MWPVSCAWHIPSTCSTPPTAHTPSSKSAYGSESPPFSFFMSLLNQIPFSSPMILTNAARSMGELTTIILCACFPVLPKFVQWITGKTKRKSTYHPSSSSSARRYGFKKGHHNNSDPLSTNTASSTNPNHNHNSTAPWLDQDIDLACKSKTKTKTKGNYHNLSVGQSFYDSKPASIHMVEPVATTSVQGGSRGGGGGGGAFSLTRSFLSSGHVACSFSQGAMHSKSNMWFLLHGRRTTRGYSSGRIVLAGGKRWWEMMKSDSPSRKGLLQIGQSIVGFRSLFGTRSSSADVAWVSYGSGERCLCTRCSSRDAHSSHLSSKRRNNPTFPRQKSVKPFSTHRPETPD